MCTYVLTMKCFEVNVPWVTHTNDRTLIHNSSDSVGHVNSPTPQQYFTVLHGVL